MVFRRLVSLYLENRDLILMGGHSPGQDPDLDLAVQLWPQLMGHVQPFDENHRLMNLLLDLKVCLAVPFNES